MLFAVLRSIQGEKWSVSSWQKWSSQNVDTAGLVRADMIDPHSFDFSFISRTNMPKPGVFVEFVTISYSVKNSLCSVMSAEACQACIFYFVLWVLWRVCSTGCTLVRFVSFVSQQKCCIKTSQSWAPTGGQRGQVPLWNLNKMTSYHSYAALLQNTLKFSLSSSALAIHLTFSLKRRRKRKHFRCAVGAPKKLFFYLRRAEKLLTFLGFGGFAPLWNIFCGRPCFGAST